MDDVLVGAGSQWPSLLTIGLKALEESKWKMLFQNLPNVFYLPQIQSVVKVYKNSLKWTNSQNSFFDNLTTK